MARRRVRKCSTPRSIHTHKSDYGQALNIVSRSNNQGPRPFTEGYLLNVYHGIKIERDGKLGKHADRAFKEILEETITRKFLQRLPHQNLIVTETGRDRLRGIRREMRQADVPPSQKPTAEVKLLKEMMGPQNSWTKQRLHRAYNDEIYRHVPRAQPLHAWSSVSTVDGTVRWGEEEVEMSMDDQDETEPIAGFSRSPVRPPSDPTALYPTPRTAPRPSGSRSRQRAVPPVPGTPTSGPRLSRTGTGQAATLMDVDHGDDQDDEYEHDGMLINRRINWEGLDNEAGIPKCNHTLELAAKRVENDELRRQIEKKAHDEKAARSEKEAVAIDRDNIVKERDGLAAEKVTLIGERDALVVERDGLAEERAALTAKNTELEGESARLHDQVIDLERQLKELQSDKERWAEEREQDAEHKRVLDAQVAKLQSTVDALRGNVHELEKEKTRLLGQHQTDVDSLADLQSRLDQAHAHLGKLQDECRAAQADRAELETQLKDVQDTLAKRTNELESTSRELQSALFDLGQERNISGQLGAEKQVLQNTVEEQETAKQILRDEVDELKKDVERCRTELRTYDGILRLLEEQRQACLPLAMVI